MSTDELKRRRRGIKSKVTIFSKFISPFLTKNIMDITDIEAINIKERSEKYQTLIHEFDEIQSHIENNITGEDADEELEVEFNERSQFESNFYDQLSLVKNLMSQLTVNNDTSSVSNHSGPSHHSEQKNLTNLVKLPKISLPTFQGKNLEWLEYRDTYESLIHNNETLSDIQKFHYLRASLEGAPADILKTMEFSAQNYATAWKCITERYNCPRLLIDYHIKALFNIEQVKRDSSLELRALSDTLMKNLRALKQLGQPTENWDVLIIALASEKLDKSSKFEWEKLKTSKGIVPTFKDFKVFLQSRAEFLESLEHNVSTDTRYTDKLIEKRKTHVTRGFLSTDNVDKKGSNSQSYSPICQLCKGSHFIQNCSEFLRLSNEERSKKVISLRMCLNCLRFGHISKNCRNSLCRKCHRKHHTLLHSESSSGFNQNHSISENITHANNTANTVQSDPVTTNQNPGTNALSASGSVDGVLLSTAFIDIADANGKLHAIRVLLDSGSQSSFISKALCDTLGLKVEKTNISVKGLNGTLSSIDLKCNVSLKSQYYNFSENITCFVLPQITENLPSIKIDVNKLDIPVNIKLADPTFYVPGKVDMLIGADLFWRLLSNGQHILGNNKPILQKTRLGWIVSGPVAKAQTSSISCNFSHNFEINIQNQLSRFWEIEELPDVKPLSQEDSMCEKHFVENFKRLPNGRFVVSLPLKDSISKLGESYSQAKIRFLNLEKNKLQTDPVFRKLYCDFMEEYITMGHMKKVEDNEKDDKITYYMPHHGVLREDSLTTKLRTVFDASAPSSSGYSLNNLQPIGPTLQDTLLSILIRFRKHSIVVSADIEKMYRNVNISSENLPLQRILWRFNSSDTLEKYELQTVTYGTTSGSFLAIRCLYQLALENEKVAPEFSEIIKSDFYVDDLLTGCESVEEAGRICIGVSNILHQGCFNLRKFMSNSPEVLKQIPGGNENAKIVNLSENENSKTLGLIWNPSLDKLMYKISEQQNNVPVTKREILSRISQVFDPLGLLSPCIIIGKILMQKLWLERISWDEGIPLHLHTVWAMFSEELPLLNSLEIDRHVICDNPQWIELHGFADSSERAYGGCIYIRSIDQHGNVTIKLLCAKTKVAPLKTITIPRLELCGCLVVSRLAEQVVKSFKLSFNAKFLWSDSTVALGWLKTEPSMLKAFVSSRIAEIQDITSAYSWNHIPGDINPADVLTRGVKPSEIKGLSLWWFGPKFLMHEKKSWPITTVKSNNLPDMRRSNTFSFQQITECTFINNFSSLPKLKRVVAYMLRWKNNYKQSKENRSLGPLSVLELNNSFNVIIKISQKETFFKEIRKLGEKKFVPHDTKILSLNPFLDEIGILRVGGRLGSSNFKYEQKHPIILSEKHHLTKLILKNEHLLSLHCGPQQLLANVRNKFWPVNGRSLARRIVHECIRCFRYNAKPSAPIMGELPRERLESRQPFEVVGVDYAGPVLIKNKIGRSSRFSKSYICLFVCFVTKAIHLELVSDLSKESFLMSFRRFCGRRGKPSIVFSDNGKNFVAASSELREFGNFIKSNQEFIVNKISNDGITWKFIPPYSPHFGGLWESGVRCTKHHLKRVIGETPLTFECLYTLLIQIEAVLNSRPLSPLSSEPGDLLPLTPAHFLVGKPLNSVPEHDVSTIPVNRLSVFQHIQQMKFHFWKRWSKEFVSELQKRVKWKINQSSLKKNDLVIIKEENLPPGRWKLGRVLEIHCGKDEIPRVATIKTDSGLIKRGFQKLCPLPLE